VRDAVPAAEPSQKGLPGSRRLLTSLLLTSLLLTLGLVAAGPARAADGDCGEQVCDGQVCDGQVCGEQIIAADAGRVRALLADPSTTLSDNPDVLAYQIEDDSPCKLVHITARGLTSPYHYTVRRCPTKTGFRETLVSGDRAVQKMDVEWRAVPHGDGTRVRLSILARIAQVPQFLVNQHTRQSIAQTLRSLGHRVERQAR